MKKTFFLMVITAITLATSSCSKDDDNNTTTPTENTLAAPQYKDDAVRLTLPENNLSVGGKQASVSLIEMAESGTYLIVYQPKATRADDGTTYMTGRYTKSDNAYNLTGFATVTVNGKSGTTYNITVKTTDGNSTELSATAASEGVVSGTMTDNICRTWKIENTRLSVKVEGISIGKDFPGTCDLNKLIDYAKERGIEINDKVENNSIVNGITFSRAGTFIISYQNGKNDVGRWRWVNQSAGTLSYGWDAPDMGNSLENGQATVSIADGKCKLTMGATINGYEVQADYTLAPSIY